MPLGCRSGKPQTILLPKTFIDLGLNPKAMVSAAGGRHATSSFLDHHLPTTRQTAPFGALLPNQSRGADDKKTICVQLSLPRPLANLVSVVRSSTARL